MPRTRAPVRSSNDGRGQRSRQRGERANSARTTLALVSSRGPVHSAGSSAECAGRYSVCATVASVTSPNVAATGPSRPRTAPAANKVTARITPIAASTRSRRTASATVAANGASSAPGSIRSAATSPTAAGPPASNATRPARPAPPSPARTIANAACARRRLRSRKVSANASPATRIDPRAGRTPCSKVRDRR